MEAGASLAAPATTRQPVEAFLRNLDETPSTPLAPYPGQDDERLSCPGTSSDLTEHNLRVFLQARGITPPIQRTDESSVSKMSTTTINDTRSRISYNHPSYPDLLVERGIVHSDDLPSNWNTLCQTLRSESNDPSPEDCDVFAQLATRVSNETTFTSAVVCPIIRLQDLLLSEHVDVVCNGQWKDNPLPSRVPAVKKLSIPKPDVTVGFKFDAAQCRAGVDVLSGSTPVACRPQLIYPSFSLEAKGLNTDIKGCWQNEHNAAIMLRNLRSLREDADSDGWATKFDNKVVVLTATLTQLRAGVRGHWTHVAEDGFVEYRSAVVKSWDVERCSLQEITTFIRNAVSFINTQTRPWVMADLHAISVRTMLQLQLPSHPPSPSSNRKRPSGSECEYPPAERRHAEWSP